MALAIMILAAVTGLVTEQLFPSSALLGFARPPIVACVIAFYAMNHSAALMLLTALIGGILSDCAAALPLGVTALALAAVGIVLRHYRDIVFSGKLVTNVIFGAAIGLGVPLLIFGLLLFLGRVPADVRFQLYLVKFINMAIYGAVFFPMVYFLLERLEAVAGASTLEASRD